MEFETQSRGAEICDVISCIRSMCVNVNGRSLRWNKSHDISLLIERNRKLAKRRECKTQSFGVREFPILFSRGTHI